MCHSYTFLQIFLLYFERLLRIHGGGLGFDFRRVFGHFARFSESFTEYFKSNEQPEQSRLIATFREDMALLNNR